MSAPHSPSPQFPATYGEVMLPFQIERLPSYIQNLYGADPIFREWLDLADKTRRAEKISSWTTWTPAEGAADALDDVVQFSRLRGYTEVEIADFERFVDLVGVLSERYSEEDFCVAVLHCHDLACSTPALEAITGELIRMASERRRKMETLSNRN